jgi:hypothetical protein
MFVAKVQGIDRIKAHEDGIWAFLRGKNIGVHAEIYMDAEKGETVRLYKLINGERHLMASLSEGKERV